MKDADLKFWTTKPNIFLVTKLSKTGQIVGCISYKQNDPSTVEMHRCAVDLNFRRFGIGKKLVMALLEEARSNGYDTMYLETSDAQGNPQKLYEKTGFHLVNEEPWPLPRLGILMCLKLSCYSRKL